MQNDLNLYITTTDKKGVRHHRVFTQTVADELAKGEWDRYWDGDEVPEGPLDLVQWWKSMESELPTLARIALRTLPMPHSGCDVERSFSYYRLSRTSLQMCIQAEHHIGRLSFAMNDIVPAV